MNAIIKLFKFILWLGVAFCVLVVVLGLMKTDLSKYFGNHKVSSNETPKVSQVAPKKVNKEKPRVAQKRASYTKEEEAT